MIPQRALFSVPSADNRKVSLDSHPRTALRWRQPPDPKPHPLPGTRVGGWGSKGSDYKAQTAFTDRTSWGLGYNCIPASLSCPALFTLSQSVNLKAIPNFPFRACFPGHVLCRWTEDPYVGPGTEVSVAPTWPTLIYKVRPLPPPPPPSPCAQMTISLSRGKVVRTGAQIPQSPSWSNPALRGPKASLQEGDLEDGAGIGEGTYPPKGCSPLRHQPELLCNV